MVHSEKLPNPFMDGGFVSFKNESSEFTEYEWK